MHVMEHGGRGGEGSVIPCNESLPNAKIAREINVSQHAPPAILRLCELTNAAAPPRRVTA